MTLHEMLDTARANQADLAPPLTTLTIGWRTWLALGVTVTLSLTVALTFAGILVVGLGLPLAWRIDRASYSWAEQTEAAPEGGGW